MNEDIKFHLVGRRLESWLSSCHGLWYPVVHRRLHIAVGNSLPALNKFYFGSSQEIAPHNLLFLLLIAFIFALVIAIMAMINNADERWFHIANIAAALPEPLDY